MYKLMLYPSQTRLVPNHRPRRNRFSWPGRKIRTKNLASKCMRQLGPLPTALPRAQLMWNKIRMKIITRRQPYNLSTGHCCASGETLIWSNVCSPSRRRPLLGKWIKHMQSDHRRPKNSCSTCCPFDIALVEPSPRTFPFVPIACQSNDVGPACTGDTKAVIRSVQNFTKNSD